MSSEITPDDKIWNIFLGYSTLISNEANKLGMDIYGTEQRTTMATSLTMSHMLDHIVCKLKDLEEQQLKLNRSKHYIKTKPDA